MESSLKEKFDKYELLITPLLLVLILLLTIIFIPQIAPIDNLFQIFLIPLLIGILSGLLFTYLLDKYWKKVDNKNISKFLTLPTLVLILISSLATLIVSYDVNISFLLIGFGLGNMISLISVTSVVVYIRTYTTKKIF